MSLLGDQLDKFTVLVDENNKQLIEIVDKKNEYLIKSLPINSCSEKILC